MKHKGTTIAVVFAFSAGACAATIATQTAPTRAQLTPGTFRECFAATLYWDQGRAVNAGRIPDQRNVIPRGWTYAGGTVAEGHPAMVLCR